ncbi:L,D-transpeptidase family protein [Streptomyces graminofaciens]|nr:L,D-transpeptidase family protein [Streptomyces graminofaciens]
MRTTGMRKSVAAVAALVLAGACTAQAVNGGGDGDRRGPVHIDVPSTPKQDEKKEKEKDGEGGSSRAPSASPDAPAPAVLWSEGDTGRDIRELQARLRQVAWLFVGPTGTYDELTVRAVKGFQGKRGLPQTGKTDSVTWARLLKMTREPGKWDLYAYGGQPAAAPDPRCATGRVLCISKTSRTLRWMVDGRTLMTVEVRFGAQYTPTREGVFSVYFKSRHHWSTLYDTSMPYAMFFSGGQAVHYSSDFAARGYYGASHGCVNVRDETRIAELFAQVRNGDKVVVYW